MTALTLIDPPWVCPACCHGNHHHCHVYRPHTASEECTCCPQSVPF